MGFSGGFEWLIIALIILFFFGAKKIPGMARGIGKGIFEFRKAVHDGEKEGEKEKTEQQDKTDEEKQDDSTS